MEGIVYVLTNAAMPGLVKIGKTSATDPEERMKSLYSTGVPVPFDCEMAVRVGDAGRVERKLHQAFRNSRLNPGREFFKIDPDQACAILELLDGEDVTPAVSEEIQGGLPPGEQEAAKKLRRKRRPDFHFIKMGIPAGATLVYEGDNGITAEVINDRKILFQGEETYLTRATRKVSGEDKPNSVGDRWKYGDQTVGDLWEEWVEKLEKEMYVSEDESED